MSQPPFMQTPDRYTREGIDPALIAPGLDDPKRLAVLEESGLVGAAADEAFDRFTRLARHLLGTEVAMINLVTDERQVTVSGAGLGDPWATLRQAPLSHSFCQHMIDSGSPLIVADLRQHPTLKDSLGVDAYGLMAYAGVPLTTSDDQTLGSFCVLDPEVREWTGREVEILRDLAAAVMNEIDLRISQRRLIRERTFLSSVLDNLEDGVFAADMDGNLLLANDAMRRLQPAGLPSDGAGLSQLLQDTEVRDRRTSTKVPDDERPLARALRGERTHRAQYTVAVDEGRIVRELDVSAAPIITPDGDQVGALTTSHDVTEQHLAERAREEFFGLISHELRTPLAAIIGYLEMLEEVDGDKLSHEGRGFLKVLDRNGERLMRLVGDLLFAAQVESGTLSLALGDVDVAELVNHACEAALPRATSTGLQISCSVADDAPRTIRGDAGRLAQVVDNLVNNALKFTPRGGSVRIEAERAGDQLVLHVRDTGPGIPAEEQERLFERFVRARAATDAQVQGVGLGLAICKSIVDGHHGSISLDSTLGDGTTFTVQIPIDPTDNGSAPAATTTTAKERHQP